MEGKHHRESLMLRQETSAHTSKLSSGPQPSRLLGSCNCTASQSACGTSRGGFGASGAASSEVNTEVPIERGPNPAWLNACSLNVYVLPGSRPSCDETNASMLDNEPIIRRTARARESTRTPNRAPSAHSHHRRGGHRKLALLRSLLVVDVSLRARDRPPKPPPNH